MRRLLTAALIVLVPACGPGGRNGGFGPGGSPDLSMRGGRHDAGPNPGGQTGCGELQGCYTVYAHDNKKLYHIDLAGKTLVEIGPFNTPSGENMTDLAVATDDTIYAISKTNLYTADPHDGHVTLVGPVTTCGTDNVALTFTPDGSLYAADFRGAFCKIDLATRPPTVTQIGDVGGGMGISGDLVAVADGTMYGTAYLIADGNKRGSGKNNFLVKLDPATGMATQTIGKTGYPELFGIAFDQGQVFGFSHDPTAPVVTIDPKTGVGTPYGTFTDASGMGISFSGAGVNAMVPAPPIM